MSTLKLLFLEWGLEENSCLTKSITVSLKQ